VITSYDLLKAEIAGKRESLSPRLRQLAEFALCHPNDMALETIAVIAERAGVPPSSLIRFASAFGFDGFSAMQRVFRSQLVERSTDYAERIRALRDADAGATPAAILDHLAGAGIRALDQLRAGIRPERLEQAVELLAAAEAIHIIGQRRTFAVAAYLSYVFGQLGPRTHLLDGVGGMTLHQASFITARDVLVVVSYAPYAPETLAVAHRADERGVPIVALTDGPLSPLLPLARVAFEVEEADLEGFRSLSATMCLALALVVRLGQRQSETGQPRRSARPPKRAQAQAGKATADDEGLPALTRDPAE
jgi:DNA-binding MurR/RpiR family transcriptional regulator